MCLSFETHVARRVQTSYKWNKNVHSCFIFYHHAIYKSKTQNNFSINNYSFSTTTFLLVYRLSVNISKSFK